MNTMRKTIITGLACLTLCLAAYAAVVTTGIPVSQLPTTNAAPDSAWLIVNQNRYGKLTNDTFKIAKSNLFDGISAAAATNLYVSNFYSTNVYVTNLYATNIYTTNIVGYQYWTNVNDTLLPVDASFAFTISTNTGWTGTGSNFFADDGMFHSIECPTNITINPTDGYIPYRSNATAFADSPWYRVDASRLGFGSTAPFLSVNSILNNQGMGLHAVNEGLASGVDNTGFGPAALYTVNVGSFNSGFGFDALTSATSSDGGTAVGSGALHDTLDGSYNVGVGYRAGYTNVSGTHNIFIGHDANPISGSLTNTIAIGDTTFVTNSSEIVIGNTNNTKAIFPITSYGGTGGLFLSDDGTYKSAASVAGNSYWTNKAGILQPLDLTLPLMITNQVQFGPGATNVLYRSGNNLLYSFSNSTGGQIGYIGVTNNTDNSQALFGAGGNVAVIRGISGVDLNDGISSGRSLRWWANELTPLQSGSELGHNGGGQHPWGNFKQQGTYYNYGFNPDVSDLTNYSRLAVSHTGTNGAVVLDSQVAGTAGDPRPIALQLGSTNQFLIGDGWVQLARGITKAQKAAITATNGMIVYQTDNTPGLRAYVNGSWVMISTVADP